MYRSDHVKVLKVLAENLPKRSVFKTKDIVGKAFKRCKSGDRRVRNAYRQLVKERHAETVERGAYRLTASGAALCRKQEKDNWQILEEPKKLIKKPAKKLTKKPARLLGRRPQKKVAAAGSSTTEPRSTSEKGAVAGTLSF